MNRRELINEVAEKLGTTKKHTTAVFDAIEEVIEETTHKGEDVKAFSFLNLKVVDVPERTGVVQLGEKKGETWVKPAHKEVKPKLAKTFRDINE